MLAECCGKHMGSFMCNLLIPRANRYGGVNSVSSMSPELT